jgi:hypothetical protein
LVKAGDMLSVKAIYDGKELKFKEKIKVNTPHEVIVTFLDEPGDDITSNAVQQMAMEGGALNFLNEPEEDIYSDKDLKVKY